MTVVLEPSQFHQVRRVLMRYMRKKGLKFKAPPSMCGVSVFLTSDIAVKLLSLLC
jgi:hypothetical protein